MFIFSQSNVLSLFRCRCVLQAYIYSFEIMMIWIMTSQFAVIPMKIQNNFDCTIYDRNAFAHLMVWTKPTKFKIQKIRSAFDVQNTMTSISLAECWLYHFLVQCENVMIYGSWAASTFSVIHTSNRSQAGVLKWAFLTFHQYFTVGRKT